MGSRSNRKGKGKSNSSSRRICGSIFVVVFVVVAVFVVVIVSVVVLRVHGQKFYWRSGRGEK